MMRELKIPKQEHKTLTMAISRTGIKNAIKWNDQLANTMINMSITIKSVKDA